MTMMMMIDREATDDIRSLDSIQPPGSDTAAEPGQPTEEQIAAMARLKAMMAGKSDADSVARTGPPPTPGHRI